MGLNISKGNMYSFITHTFNTIKGICPHGCAYCYMKRFPQKTIRFDEKELNTDLGENNFIFVGSSCDMFAEEIPEKWILDTFDYCESFRKNYYLFQTKNPTRFCDLIGFVPYKSIVCTTIETNRQYQQMGEAPPAQVRAEAMWWMEENIDKYVTIEPIMDFDLYEMIELIEKCEPKQVNIGADSGNNRLPEPPKDKILELIEELEKFTIIDQKRNLARLLK